MDDRNLMRAMEAERKLKAIKELLDEAQNELMNEGRYDFVQAQLRKECDIENQGY